VSPFYDPLETRDPAEREQALLAALSRCVATAQRATPTLAQWLQGVEAGSLTSRAALACLPVLRKSELMERQQCPAAANTAHDPFGGFSTIGWRGLAAASGARRVFQSPGPVYEPQGQGQDYWRMARALWAAGFRTGDLVHCSFSFHLTPAGAMVESAAHALGCTVFPGGVGNTELQLRAIADLRPQAYAGTPGFLKVLVEQAAAHGLAIPSLTRAVVSGEAFPPSLRDWLIDRGIEALQCYASADLGLIAYETPAREGLVVDEGVIVEIVRPGTGEPLPDGEVGEVLVTVPNPDYPLIRFGTGDLSAVLPGQCPSGRTNVRIKGWMGRADQAAKVRGMFIHPSQVAGVLARHPEVCRARLVVRGEMADDQLLLRAEVQTAVEGLAARLADTVRDVTRLRCEVELVPNGTLPDDGRVIEDARTCR
jgi:phenylacetate-CoA ligase